jgi:hypothetical protein
MFISNIIVANKLNKELRNLSAQYAPTAYNGSACDICGDHTHGAICIYCHSDATAEYDRIDAELRELSEEIQQPAFITTQIGDNYLRIAGLSPHGFRLSNGDEVPGQVKEFVDAVRVDMESTPVDSKLPVSVSRQTLSINSDGLAVLEFMQHNFDITIVPFMVISALDQMGVRDKYPNVLAYNATPETRRSAPADKVVDLDNWSY